jgi:hypothetical protein
MPNGNTTWLMLAYGVPASVASDMVNSALAMVGTTGNDGYATETMFGSIYYNVIVSSSTLGVSGYSKQFMPLDNEYILQIQPQANSAIVQNYSLTQMNATMLTITYPNISYISFNLNFSDVSGYTQDVNYMISDYNNGTVYYTKDEGNPGTSLLKDSYVMKNQYGLQIVQNWTSTRVTP